MLESESLAAGRVGMVAAQAQWGQGETQELIWIRGELERDFTAAKRKKTLWELVSARMKEKGYFRTPDQCKCKWKNLLNRYKGKETSDPENGRQCPFFEELHAVFTERAKNMQRQLLESEAGSAQVKKRIKRPSGYRSSDEFSEDEGEEECESEEERPARSNSRKRKAEKNITLKSPRDGGNSNVSVTNMLREFFQQQQRMEIEWREMMEKRAQERELFEQEWRQSMLKLEKERLMAEQAWREEEEQRRIREERRAERRDALLTTLLKRLINDNNV